MSEDKERAVKRLQELEDEERNAVRVLRDSMEAGGSLRGKAARIIAAEAAANSYAIARDVVQGVPF